MAVDPRVVVFAIACVCSSVIGCRIQAASTEKVKREFAEYREQQTAQSAAAVRNLREQRDGKEKQLYNAQVIYEQNSSIAGGVERSLRERLQRQEASIARAKQNPIAAEASTTPTEAEAAGVLCLGTQQAVVSLAAEADRLNEAYAVCTAYVDIVTDSAEDK